MPRLALVLIEAFWVALGAVWLAGALVARKPERREPLATRLGHSAVLLAGFGFVFSPQTGVGPLGWRLMPPAFAWFGVAAAGVGTGLALWARLRLGRNWSGAANLGRDHELIESGPYAFVRHPIYAGLLLGLLGTAIAIGEVRGFVGVGLVLAGFWWKSSLEEKLLIQRFGSRYLAYRARVRASLVPYLI
jgi:protein-S-isoprenylcysteine O-methyltransferase Ste14